MKNQYLIFPNPKDIQDYIYFKCSKEELYNKLVGFNIIEPGVNYFKLGWIIFENGIIIQG